MGTGAAWCIAFEGDDFEIIRELKDFIDFADGRPQKVITAVDKKTREIIILNNGVL